MKETDMEWSLQYADILAQMRSLRAERDQKILEIKERYYAPLDELTAKLRALSGKKPKKSAIERYTENDESPSRHCEKCGGELLKANLENAHWILAHYREEGDAVAGWADVRRMTGKHCCYRCSHGLSGHSNGCSLVTREDEDCEEGGKCQS